MKKTKRLCDAYWFQGFRPHNTLKGLFGDPVARIISLQRLGKKLFVEVVEGFRGLSTTEEPGWFGTNLAGIYGYTWRWNCGGWSAGVVEP
jgi:hypothetical protein